MPSVLYIIFNPVMTDDVSRVAAPCALSVVDGEDVDIGRLCEGLGLVDFDGAECFGDAVGERGVVGAFAELRGISLCCVCIRVFTTSSGVVITPAMPPALAAVAISSGSPMLFEPMNRFAWSRSSS
jgi:hypothetical protein